VWEYTTMPMAGEKGGEQTNAACRGWGARLSRRKLHPLKSSTRKKKKIGAVLTEPPLSWSRGKKKRGEISIKRFSMFEEETNM